MLNKINKSRLYSYGYGLANRSHLDDFFLHIFLSLGFLGKEIEEAKRTTQPSFFASWLVKYFGGFIDDRFGYNNASGPEMLAYLAELIHTDDFSDDVIEEAMTTLRDVVQQVLASTAEQESDESSHQEAVFDFTPFMEQSLSTYETTMLTKWAPLIVSQGDNRAVVRDLSTAELFTRFKQWSAWGNLSHEDLKKLYDALQCRRMQSFTPGDILEEYIIPILFPALVKIERLIDWFMFHLGLLDKRPDGYNAYDIQVYLQFITRFNLPTILARLSAGRNNRPSATLLRTGLMQYVRHMFDDDVEKMCNFLETADGDKLENLLYGMAVYNGRRPPRLDVFDTTVSCWSVCHNATHGDARSGHFRFSEHYITCEPLPVVVSMIQLLKTIKPVIDYVTLLSIGDERAPERYSYYAKAMQTIHTLNVLVTSTEAVRNPHIAGMFQILRLIETSCDKQVTLGYTGGTLANPEMQHRMESHRQALISWVRQMEQQYGLHLELMFGGAELTNN